MMRKILEFPLLIFVVIISILFTITMESSITMYLTDTVNQNYYIYQAILYSLSGFIVIKNRKQIRPGRILVVIFAFCLMCFMTSLIHLQSMSIRGLISLFFNTCIIPFALLNGFWFGGKLNSVKDRDFYLIILQVPALYAMILLRAFNETGYWFDADAAFCVIVFFPFVFFFKRNWIAVLFSLIYIVFTLTSGKRSILVFIAFCLVLYLLYLLVFERKRVQKKLFSRVLVVALIIFGGYFIISNENSGLMHAYERIELLGGMADDNGRISIYQKTADAISRSNGFSIIFGHGHMAVKNDTGMGAHNDLLEISYDYGVIAAFLYVIILVYFITNVVKFFREKDYYKAMIVGACVSSIVILGMLNCIIVSTVLMFSMFFALGCALQMENKSIE